MVNYFEYILKYILYKNAIKILIIKTIINIIALTICKYTLPKNFINNNFKTFLLILILIQSILLTPFMFKAIVNTDQTNKHNTNSILMLFVTFIAVFLSYIFFNFILGYIMRSYYPNVENNYKIFSIPLVIF